MIAHLRGKVAARRIGAVVVDVGGVGYLVHVPDGASVPPRGATVELHTSLQVREDAMTLYGFPDAGARDLFEALLGASGVGPRLALAALSTHGPAALVRAIGDGDVEALRAIPGVGTKVAQRLVLELREKVGGAAGGELPGEVPAGALGEVREALVALGYSAAEARRATGGLDPDGDAGALLRRALRALAEGTSGSTAGGETSGSAAGGESGAGGNGAATGGRSGGSTSAGASA